MPSDSRLDEPKSGTPFRVIFMEHKKLRIWGKQGVGVLGSGNKKSLNGNVKLGSLGCSYRGKSSRWEKVLARARASFPNVAKQLCSLRIMKHFDVWILFDPWDFKWLQDISIKLRPLNIIELDTCLSDKTFPFIKNSYWASPQLGSRGSQALLCGPELPTACGLSMSHHRPTFPGWNTHGWKGFNVACSHSCLEM